MIPEIKRPFGQLDKFHGNGAILVGVLSSLLQFHPISDRGTTIFPVGCLACKVQRVLVDPGEGDLRGMAAASLVYVGV